MDNPKPTPHTFLLAAMERMRALYPQLRWVSDMDIDRQEYKIGARIKALDATQPTGYTETLVYAQLSYLHALVAAYDVDGFVAFVYGTIRDHAQRRGIQWPEVE